MAITFTLVERTPYRLRYLCTTSGTTGLPDTGILVNRGGPTPDLRTDSAIWRDFPIQDMMSKTVADQAEARTNMFGDDLITNADLEVPRCRVKIYARTQEEPNDSEWAVDTTRGDLVDALSTNFPVFVVFGPAEDIPQTAYLEINFEHTRQR